MKISLHGYIYALMYFVLCALTVAYLLSCIGCAAAPTQYKPVPIEVPVPCKTKPVTVPKWQGKLLPAGDNDIYDLSQAASIELTQRRQYETLLLAANQACE